MDFNDLLVDAFGRIRDAVHGAAADCSPATLAYRPAPDANALAVVLLIGVGADLAGRLVGARVDPGDEPVVALDPHETLVEGEPAEVGHGYRGLPHRAQRRHVLRAAGHRRHHVRHARARRTPARRTISAAASTKTSREHNSGRGPKYDRAPASPPDHGVNGTPIAVTRPPRTGKLLATQVSYWRSLVLCGNSAT